MGKYKYKFGKGFAFFEKSDMDMCEKMASNGYHLIEVNGFGFYKFEQGEPVNCRYSFDFLDVKPGDEGFGQYKEIFESGGWEYICSQENLHWFRSADEGAMSIYTDNANLSLKHQKMFRLSIHTALGGALAAAIFYVLSQIITYPLFSGVFYLLMAGGIGLALAMSAGVILNYWRIGQLNKTHSKF